MKVGTVSSAILLDHSPNIVRAVGEPVTGRVRLRFTPSKKTESDELFGPLQIRIEFWGRAKSKITRSNGNSTSHYRGRAPLFSETILIYDGAFKATSTTPFETPFSVNFPATTEARQSRMRVPQSTNNLSYSPFEPSMVFEQEPGHPLPPSMMHNSSSFGSNFECFVEYKLSAFIRIPGIDVETPNASDASVPYTPPSSLTYDHRRLMTPSTRKLSIQTKLLLPEDERPSGFRAKAKAAVFTTYPRFNFNITTSLSQHLQVGSQPRLIVKVAPLLEESTTLRAPEIEVVSYVLKLKASTLVRAEKTLWREYEDSEDTTIWKHDSEAPSLRYQQYPVFNTVTLNAGNDWTTSLECSRIANVPPTFRTYNIRRTYSATVKIMLRCAGEKLENEISFRSTVLHPIERQVANVGGNEPGPSMGMRGGENLPQYEGQDLPSYEGSSNTTLLKTGPTELEGSANGKMG